MANDKAAKSKPKRRVKDPETFRERAVKASAADAKQPVRKAGAKRTPKLKLPKPLGRSLNLVGKVIFPAYLRNSWRELKLVTWPNWKQSRQLTFAVLVFAVVFGAVIAAVDYGLDKVFRNVLLK